MPLFAILQSAINIQKTEKSLKTSQTAATVTATLHTAATVQVLPFQRKVLLLTV